MVSSGFSMGCWLSKVESNGGRYQLSALDYDTLTHLHTCSHKCSTAPHAPHEQQARKENKLNKNKAFWLSFSYQLFPSLWFHRQDFKKIRHFYTSMHTAWLFWGGTYFSIPSDNLKWIKRSNFSIFHNRYLCLQVTYLVEFFFLCERTSFWVSLMSF